MQSVYFEGNSIEFTEYSFFILNRLKSSFDKGDYQIIEVNGFSSSGSTYQENYNIAKKRIYSVFDHLESDTVDVTINIFGEQKTAVNFLPESWDRIDIYYDVNDSWRDQEKAYSKVPKDSFPEWHMPKRDTSLFIEVSPYYYIPDGKPVPLNLYFKGNRGVLIGQSIPALDQLYRTMASYPNITAHFRGHVCCGDKMRLSKKRARSVYKYLRKRGISKSRLSFEGCSNTQPLVSPERTEKDRAKNRRVDVIYTKN